MLLSLSLLLAAPSAFAARGLEHSSTVAPVEGQRWALLIGVNTYEDTSIHPLQFAEDDARALAETLHGGGFDATHVIVMSSSARDPKLRPTRANILARLEALRQSLSDADELIVSFSGHGLSATQPDGKHDYLLPVDAALLVPQDSALDLRLVLARIDAIPARRRLVLLDACRDELTDSRGANEGAWVAPDLETAEGTRIFYSSSFGGVSYESPEDHMGAFSAAVVSGLRGAADGAVPAGSADGVVDAQELYSWVKARLRERCVNTGQCQEPEQSGHWTGDGVFAVVSLGAPPAPTPAAAAPGIQHTTTSLPGQPHPSRTFALAGAASLGLSVASFVVAERTWSSDQAGGAPSTTLNHGSVIAGYGFGAASAGLLVGALLRGAW